MRRLSIILISVIVSVTIMFMIKGDIPTKQELIFMIKCIVAYILGYVTGRKCNE